MSLSVQNVLDLASKMRVLTLATFFNQKTWTAPVYYVFSNPDSRHIKEALYSQNSEQSQHIKLLKNQIAASVFSDDTNFKNIKGLQMQGEIMKVGNKKDAILRAMEYIKKFKIYYNKEDVLEFFQKEYRARLYHFIPEAVYYLDNKKKFGFRERIEL